MHITDTFASTVAVTIPVLMLAGTVELRSFADAVTKRTVEWQKELVLSSFDLAKLIARIRKQKDWTKISLWKQSLNPIPMPGLPLGLPFIWFVALTASGIAEVYNLLYLAGAHNQYDSVNLSIISIIALMILLIVTSAARTFVLAPWMGIQQYIQKARKLDLDEDTLEAVLDVIPTAVDIKAISAGQGKEMTQIIQSRLEKAASAKKLDDGHQGRWRPQVQPGYRSSSRRPPRWAAQRHISRGGSSYRDSSRML